MKFLYIPLVLLITLNNVYAGTYSQIVDADIPFLTGIIEIYDNPNGVRDVINQFSNSTNGMKATMVQSNFTLCKADATSRYAISKLNDGPSYAPQLKKWRKSTINDNGVDLLTFTDIHHDYQHVIYCKKYNTGDSYKIVIKHCTTENDRLKNLNKMEGGIFPDCRK